MSGKLAFDERNRDLTDRTTHFEFGANWRDYARTVDKTRIDFAVAGMRKLFPEGLAGKTFLDIGCGSGLHSLAALMLGAAKVVATDIDENSVSTTAGVLQKHAAGQNWQTKLVSIFDASPESLGKFDVVYSWGVLHHTGKMWTAIERASALVAPEGQFALAIYAKTPFDLPWKIEKRIYSSAPAGVQWMLRQSFTAVLVAAKLARGKNPKELFDQPLSRGMNSLMTCTTGSVATLTKRPQWPIRSQNLRPRIRAEAHFSDACCCRRHPWFRLSRIGIHQAHMMPDSERKKVLILGASACSGTPCCAISLVRAGIR